MLFSRPRKFPDIQKGLFHRVRGKAVAEVAEVIWVGDNSAGIRHVRFNLSYVRSKNQEPQGSRMLSVEAFNELYQPLEQD